MTRLADQLRAAFLTGVDHAGGWDAVADKAEELLTPRKPNLEAAGEEVRRGFYSMSGDVHADGIAHARRILEAAQQPFGWANPPACIVCGARGVVAEIRCAEHSAGEKA